MNEKHEISFRNGNDIEVIDFDHLQSDKLVKFIQEKFQTLADKLTHWREKLEHIYSIKFLGIHTFIQSNQVTINTNNLKFINQELIDLLKCSIKLTENYLLKATQVPTSICEKFYLFFSRNSKPHVLLLSQINELTTCLKSKLADLETKNLIYFKEGEDYFTEDYLTIFADIIDINKKYSRFFKKHVSNENDKLLFKSLHILKKACKSTLSCFIESNELTNILKVIEALEDQQDPKILAIM